MKYTTIRIEGAILSADILDKIEQGELGGQLSKDFGFDSNVKVKDEIVRAWADAQDLWRIFKRHRESVSQNATGTTETRRYWILPLLGLLGYEIELSKAEIVNDKTYAISHRAKNLDSFPIHIMGFNDSLDKKREDSGPRMSPHALVQEYVNLTEYLYAIVTNGIFLRFLRDSSRLIKLSFIEFDLEAMMEEEHYADFAIMYRLLHSSRMPVNIEAGPESIIEKYHQDALDSGSRIRDGLRAAVKFSIESLANGFLKHPTNELLREDFQQKTLPAYDYYQRLLRLIYRLLFLMVIEERDLIYPRNADKTKRDIYYNYYSINHLRRLCEKGYLEEERYSDLWICLKNTFRLFESESKGNHLDIKPLAGDLFGYDAIGILNNCHLDNKTILECLKHLSVFINQDTGQKIRVNYASLNTEEFGSVYEGLLEYAPEVLKEDGGYKFIFTKGSERSATGTHYTPDELVQPLIKHSLDYIIEDKLKGPDPEKALLSIRVCDVAAGSGHILLNAARRIGAEFAKVRTGEDQPSPTAYRAGVRDAIRNCIYGVDKNPLAVELCKVSLWLEAHIPGEPLNFLDHHIKCGDSIVGLAHKEELLNGIATEAFKKLPGDDPDVVKQLSKKNREDLDHRRQLTLDFEQSVTDNIRNIASLLNKLNTMPETTPAEVAAKQKEYQKLTGGPLWWRLKNLADIQVAQFFIPKTKENENKLITDAEYREYLKGRQMVGMGIAKATAAALDKRFFHWFLEFPEVFTPSPVGEGQGEGKSGFDCILGNPPYLGGRNITSQIGKRLNNTIFYLFKSSGTSVDLCSYFVKRIWTLLRQRGQMGCLATESISFGANAKTSLEYILRNGGHVRFAKTNVEWPGNRARRITIINICKENIKSAILNGISVSYINQYLQAIDGNTEEPFRLNINAFKAFQGITVFGNAFIVKEKACESFCRNDPSSKEVLTPYLTGENLNRMPLPENTSFVINFHGKSEEEASKFILCFKRLEKFVKEKRISVTSRKDVKEKWWSLQRVAPELEEASKSCSRILCRTRYGAVHGLMFVDKKGLFSDGIIAFAFDSYAAFAILQSDIHFIWAQKYGSSRGGALRYLVKSCFDTFPFPKDLSALYEVGQYYYVNRCDLMVKAQIGLTKTYNQFHNKSLTIIIGDLLEKEIEKKYGKETLNLWNHLKRTKNTCSFNEAVEGIYELRRLHREMDETVLKAYGWTEIDLAHDFYEVDYLPENDRIRYTISPEARREVLKRLLKLNHEIHEIELAENDRTTATKKSSKAKKSKTNSKQFSLL
jgi:type I restriction-modification system DNA methylase subunit